MAEELRDAMSNENIEELSDRRAKKPSHRAVERKVSGSLEVLPQPLSKAE
jgi:hypothetical protein